jgi:hypothetical protein
MTFKYLISLFGCISSVHRGNIIYILFGRCTECATRVFLLFPPSEHRAQCYALLDKYAPEIVRHTGVQQQRLLALKRLLDIVVLFQSAFLSLAGSLLAWVSFFECIPRSLADCISRADRVHIEKRAFGQRGKRK